MNKIRKQIGIIAAGALLLVSCTKKDGINQGLDPNNQKPYDYMSTKAGSWWVYGSASDETMFTRYAGGKDSLVNGLKYAYYYRIDTTTKFRTPEYFGKNNDKYVSLIDINGKMETYLTMVILKDNVTLGESWTNTETRMIEGYNVDMLIESQVVNVNGTYNSNGATYTNVTEVFSTLKAKSKLTAAYTYCGTLHVWFVKGIGIIREIGDIDVLDGKVSKKYEDSLMSYHIEP